MAYEIKTLAEDLKVVGLEMAEDTLLKALEVIANWANAEALKAEKGFVDVAVMALVPLAKPLIAQQIDKIDGTVGN